MELQICESRSVKDKRPQRGFCTSENLNLGLDSGNEFSGPKKQPKHKVFGRDIPGTSGTQTSGYPWQKLYASGLFLLF